ncbi:MAG: phosphonoacetaldehyde reductase [Nanoarchaeota archaeon]|nr:phosphonoacetaldehyde reductase [Nanoarchaeota archaeon]
MTKVYQNQNAIRNISSILNSEKTNSILLVRGNESYQSCGAEEFIESQLEGYNITHLFGFHKSPSIEDISRAIGVIKENNIDFIIGVGGGTVMDVAKAASILHQEKGSLDEYITGKIKLKGDNIKRLLIPTTAGTGAEITPFSVVYIGKTKYSLVHENMVPDYVILAPELTYGLNPLITAQTGADALAQAIEGFWSVNATEESKEHSREAISLVLNNLNQAVNNPNPRNRKAMLIGSHLAGKSIAIAKTTAAHALSYPLTAYHNIPHGHAAMLTLPYFFPLNENATKDNIQESLTLDYVKNTFRDLLKILGVNNGEEARDKLLYLMDNIHLKRKLSELGIQEGDLQNIIDNGFNPGRVKNNPIQLTVDMEWNILKTIL